VDVDSFIGKYRPEWSRLDEVCRGGGRRLAAMSGRELQEVVRLYLRASAHLAEARSRFHDPELEAYLNGLVARAHAAVYSAQPRSVRGFGRLLAVRYPEAVRRTLPYILIAAAVLFGITGATWWWVAASEYARSGIAPAEVQDAVRQTAARSPELGGPGELSTLILFNNVQVAFFAFALGITLGIGTLYVLARNALLIGSLAGVYQAVGNAGTFWTLILPHGILELIAICIAAGAGLRIGWSMVDPADRPRRVALREEASEAVVVVVGVIPALAIAALIEGFVTGSSLPDPFELGIGTVVSIAYLIFLSGWWPGRWGAVGLRASRRP
jgi:uncharacterized membrane protein SpoIIM required for sporulation